MIILSAIKVENTLKNKQTKNPMDAISFFKVVEIFGSDGRVYLSQATGKNYSFCLVYRQSSHLLLQSYRNDIYPPIILQDEAQDVQNDWGDADSMNP